MFSLKRASIQNEFRLADMLIKLNLILQEKKYSYANIIIVDNILLRKIMIGSVTHA